MIPSAQQPVYKDGARINVTRYSNNWQTRKSDVSNSGSTGTRYAKVIDDPQWRAEFAMDDPNFPAVLGFVRGTVIAQMHFRHGSLSDLLEETYIDSVEKTSDSTQDVPRVVVTGSGGTLTEDVATPP